jgi:hypothetical protein
VAPSIPGSIATGFLSLGVLKENVHKNNPHTLEELKQNTEPCIPNITAETLHQVASNMKKRVNAYIAGCSGHFQHLI